MMPTLVRPEPFALTAGPVGVVLIHGFTGSPPEMRPLGEHLNEHGLTVAAPLLPGHGLSVDALNRVGWRDWVRAVREAEEDLRRRCTTIFLGGLSMGSLLALEVAAGRTDLAGVMAYSPATWTADRRQWLAPLMKHFVKAVPKPRTNSSKDDAVADRIWCYDVHPLRAADELLQLQRRVRRRLPLVTCPLLIIHSLMDGAIHPQSAVRTLAQAGSLDRQMLTLTASGHCITVDGEWQAVAERTLEFIRSHSR